MEFEYKGKRYLITELKEPNSEASLDILALFEVRYIVEVDEETSEQIEVSYDEYEASNTFKYEKFNFIKYWYGADGSDDEIINEAKRCINTIIEEVL